MSAARRARCSRVAVGAWLALMLSVLPGRSAPRRSAGSTTAIAFLPLLLPLPGLARDSGRT